MRAPGSWVLNDCFYTLVRNEQKFAARNKARRMQVDAEILRPDIAKLLHSTHWRDAAAGCSTPPLTVSRSCPCAPHRRGRHLQACRPGRGAAVH